MSLLQQQNLQKHFRIYAMVSSNEKRIHKYYIQEDLFFLLYQSILK